MLSGRGQLVEHGGRKLGGCYLLWNNMRLPDLHSRVERYRSVFIWVTLPICNRAAIQAAVIRVSFLNGTASFTFSASPFLRSSSVASVPRRRRLGSRILLAAPGRFC